MTFEDPANPPKLDSGLGRVISCGISLILASLKVVLHIDHSTVKKATDEDVWYVGKRAFVGN
jgi:hypothetical protein